MTLDSPDSSTGSAAWFMQLWNQLSRDDRQDFQSKIAQMLGVRPHDFFVQIFERNECPVIFYLLSTSRLEHIVGVEGRWNLPDQKKSPTLTRLDQTKFTSSEGPWTLDLLLPGKSDPETQCHSLVPPPKIAVFQLKKRVAP